MPARERDEKEGLAGVVEVENVDGDVGDVDRAAGLDGVIPCDGPGSGSCAGRLCGFPAEEESGMVQAEGNEDVALACAAAEMDDVRLLFVVRSGVGGGGIEPPQGFDEVGGLDAFIKRVARVGSDEAVGMGVEPGDCGGGGIDDGEAESVASDEVGGRGGEGEGGGEKECGDPASWHAETVSAVGAGCARGRWLRGRCLGLARPGGFRFVLSQVPESGPGAPRVVVFGASQRQQQILRPTYPNRTAVRFRAPGVRVLRMTLWC